MTDEPDDEEPHEQEPDEPTEDEPPETFQRFERLTRAVVSVPKRKAESPAEDAD